MTVPPQTRSLVVTSDASNSWENEVYVAKSGTDSINVDAGGIDHVYLASGDDTVDVVGTLAPVIASPSMTSVLGHHQT